MNHPRSPQAGSNVSSFPVVPGCLRPPSFLPPVASRYNWKRRSLPGLGTRPRDGALLEAKAAGSECSATW